MSSLDRQIVVSGARGESYPDILRRTGLFGVLPTDTDTVAITKVNADAALSAAAAEAAGGPVYDSVEDGEAAADAGESFAVANADGTVSIYLRTVDGSTYQRTTGPTTSPLRYGAAGDGVTPDHEAFIALIAAIGARRVTVDLQGRTYLFGETNVVPLVSNISWCNGTILATADTSIVDAVGDTYGRFGNGLFWKEDATPFDQDFSFRNVIFGIQRGKVNAIAGAACSSPLDNAGACSLIDVTYAGYAAGNDVALAAVAGQSATESGGLVSLRGYAWVGDRIKMTDSGHAFDVENSLSLHLLSGSAEYSGVSRDETKWHNCAALRFGGTQYVHISPEFIVDRTGGTAVFGAGVGSQPKRHTIWPTVTGAGLSAIATGVRSYTTAAAHFELIDVSRARVQGFMCAPNGDLHDGVQCLLDDPAYGSTVAKFVANGVQIDAVAPWEAWDAATGAITGSLNTKKAKGGDTGNHRGLSVVTTGGGKRIKSLEALNVSVAHVPVIGVGLIGLVRAQVSGVVSRCGWRKDNANVAPQIQQALYWDTVDEMGFDLTVHNPAPMVAQNDSFCTPVFHKDVLVAVGKFRVTGASNQKWAIRLSNAAAGCSLKLIEYDPGPCVTSDGGRIISINPFATAANNATMIIETPNTLIVDVASGYGALYAGVRNVCSGLGYDGTFALPTATNMKGRVLSISVKSGAATATVEPAAGNTIDGSGSSPTVTAGNKLTLISDGVTNWKTVL